MQGSDAPTGVVVDDLSGCLARPLRADEHEVVAEDSPECRDIARFVSGGQFLVGDQNGVVVGEGTVSGVDHFLREELGFSGGCM